MKLSKTEEQLMQHIWKLEKAFMRDIIREYEPPVPATTTLATLLKRIKDKGFIDYQSIGKAREYFPLISKSDYYSNLFQVLLKHFLGKSTSIFASFFTNANDLSTEELKTLRKVIDDAIEKKNKE